MVLVEEKGLVNPITTEVEEVWRNNAENDHRNANRVVMKTATYTHHHSRTGEDEERVVLAVVRVSSSSVGYVYVVKTAHHHRGGLRIFSLTILCGFVFVFVPLHQTTSVRGCCCCPVPTTRSL